MEKHGYDPSGKDDNGDTPLNVAALSGRLDILMCLIDERKCSPGCRGQWGRSPYTSPRIICTTIGSFPLNGT